MPRPPLRISRIPRIPEMTVRRLSVYLRCLRQLEEAGVTTISSQDLAARFHLNSAQVRKDLAYFGEFGIRGIGYEAATLRAEIQRILGLDREWRVVLVGFGNLGSALLHHRGFARQGFRIAAVVDTHPDKVGRDVDGLTIRPLAELGAVVRAAGAQIGVIAVPPESAQDVAGRLVEAGVRAILNFAPASVTVPAGVRLQNVDLSIELEHLSFHLAQGPGGAPRGT
jgi:redox-sensing transcriptional repressor